MFGFVVRVPDPIGRPGHPSADLGLMKLTEYSIRDNKRLDFFALWRHKGTNQLLEPKEAMKILKQSFVNRMCSFQCFLILLFFTAAVIPAQAQLVSLTNNNSSIDIQTSGPGAGASNWQVDGVNQLYAQWFYYRVGPAGGESPLNAISAPTISTPTAARLDLSYNNGLYSALVRYTLTGNALGSSSAGLSETITLQNLSANVLDFHFFQYSDFDLRNLDLGQTAQFTTNGLGQYFKVTQTGNLMSVTETVTSAAVPIAHVEANGYAATITSLTDGLPTTLNDMTSFGPGDATFAYQWDISMAPGSTFIISKILSVVPEPSSAALLSLGILGFGMLRRRTRKA
jgi:hypothetical protein